MSMVILCQIVHTKQHCCINQWIEILLSLIIFWLPYANMSMLGLNSCLPPILPLLYLTQDCSLMLLCSGDKQVLQAGHTEIFKNWVVLHSNGSCSWESPANVESRCNVEISSFPFDEQQCYFLFGSATYGSESLRIHSIHPGGRLILNTFYYINTSVLSGFLPLRKSIYFHM